MTVPVGVTPLTAATVAVAAAVAPGASWPVQGWSWSLVESWTAVVVDDVAGATVKAWQVPVAGR